MCSAPQVGRILRKTAGEPWRLRRRASKWGSRRLAPLAFVSGKRDNSESRARATSAVQDSFRAGYSCEIALCVWRCWRSLYWKNQDNSTADKNCFPDDCVYAFCVALVASLQQLFRQGIKLAHLIKTVCSPKPRGDLTWIYCWSRLDYRERRALH